MFFSVYFLSLLLLITVLGFGSFYNSLGHSVPAFRGLSVTNMTYVIFFCLKLVHYY